MNIYKRIICRYCSKEIAKVKKKFIRYMSKYDMTPCFISQMFNSTEWRIAVSSNKETGRITVIPSEKNVSIDERLVRYSFSCLI